MGNTWSPLKRQLEQIPLLKTLGKGGKEIFNFIRFSLTNERIDFVNGSSRSRSIINRVERILASQKLDLLFIDGDHSYEGVKQDFLNYRHLVREGGLIAFHDIVPDYGTRYGIKTARWAGGVPQFWSEIKQFYPHYQFIKNLEQDALGIGVIRYREQVSLSNKEGENHAIKTGR